MTLSSVAITVSVFAILTASCRQQKEQTVIARVGDVELTREEANEHLDTTRGATDQQLAAFVTAWINSELIHQEAKLKALDQSEELNHRLRDLKRQLVNNEFLERYLYTDSIDISDQSLRQYYDAHHSEFVTREDMVELRIAIFDSREAASTFISRCIKLSDWDSTITDTIVRPDLVMMPRTQYYSRHTLFPPELWKIAMTLTTNELSFPVRTPAGYAVIQLLSIVRQGKIGPFGLVQDEVRQRMIIESRRRKYEELLGTLRKRYRVELFTRFTQPSDTVRPEIHE